MLTAGKLEYRHADGAYMYGEPVLLHPSPEQWEQFWVAVEAVGVWNWKHEYKSRILDGVQWELKLNNYGHSVRCYGSNAFPGCDRLDYSGDTAFARFLLALQQLTGVSEIA